MDEMLAGAPMNMLFRWQAFYEIDPFGQEREDIRAAGICLAVMQAAGAKKKSGGQFKLQDFIHDLGKKQTPTTRDPIAVQAILKARYGKK